jgi:hypothetical protein
MAEVVRLGNIDGLPGVPVATDYGLWIGDGGIIVHNGVDVVIDGSSQMYRIQATGDLDITIAVSGDTVSEADSDDTLTGLGAQDTIPAHLSFVGTSLFTTDHRFIGWANVHDNEQLWASDDEGIATDTDFLALHSQAAMRTFLNGSDIIVVRLGGENGDAGASSTFYGVYNVLDEAAL